MTWGGLQCVVAVEDVLDAVHHGVHRVADSRGDALRDIDDAVDHGPPVTLAIALTTHTVASTRAFTTRTVALAMPLITTPVILARFTMAFRMKSTIGLPFWDAMKSLMTSTASFGVQSVSQMP